MEQLGIKPLALITQVVNFLIMVFILTKVLYNPILNNLKKRREEIEKGLKFSKEMEEEKARLEEEKQKKLQEAQEEAKLIIDEAKKTAKKKEAEILLKAKNEANLLLEKTKKDNEITRKEMERSVRKDTIDIAFKVTQKLIGNILSEQQQHKVIKAKLKQLENLINDKY